MTDQEVLDAALDHWSAIHQLVLDTYPEPAERATILFEIITRATAVEIACIFPPNIHSQVAEALLRDVQSVLALVALTPPPKLN